MSTEQQDRQAAQYVERGVSFTAKHLWKLLLFTASKLSGDKTAYKIGAQKLEDLLKSPYAVSTIRLDEAFSNSLEKEVDLEKFNQLMEKKGFPLAYSWVGDTLYFYTKDKSVLDEHLTKLLETLAKNPEMFNDLTKDKDLNEEIKNARDSVVFEAGAMRNREIIR